jgi:hypothetical protein
MAAAKSERGIWQRHYWEHTIADESDFARHVDQSMIRKSGYPQLGPATCLRP